MSGSFCGNCGSRWQPGSRFCMHCGAPAPDVQAQTAGGQTAQPTTPDLPGPPDGAVTPEVTAPPHAAPRPDAGTSYGPPPVQEPLTAPRPGDAPAPPPPPGVPWPLGAGPAGTAGLPGAGVGSPGGGTSGSGRDSVDALLGGDWAGAAITAAGALAATAVVALLSLLLLGVGGVGTHELLAGTAMLVCAALGGDLFTRGASGFGSDDVTGQASAGVLPLTLTFLCLGLLGALFLRRTPTASAKELLLQALRTTLVLAALTLVLALVSRVRTDGDTGLLQSSGRVGASVGSSVVGAVLFSVATLALAVLLRRAAALPPRLAAVRTQFLAPLLAATAVLGLGLVAAVCGLVYSLSTEDDRMQQLGLALLALPNLALGSVLLAMGVPLTATGSASSVNGDFGESTGEFGTTSVSLLSLTEQSAWWWFAPVVLALTLVAAAVAVVVRQNTLAAARREALRFAAALALVAAVCALLLRIGVSGGASLLSAFSGEGSLSFNPLVAAVVAGLWGLAAAVAAPQVATRISGGLVHSVRTRFGTAPVEAAPASPAGPR